MHLLRGLQALGSAQRHCVASIGNFDGVHRGHQVILQRLRAAAQAHNLPGCVIIFEPQPLEFLRPDTAPARLTPLRDKVHWLSHYGVDQILCLRFNDHLRHLTAAAFTQQVLQGLGVRYLEVGDDFRFGCDRSGDYAFLKNQETALGMQVKQVPTTTLDGERISSTRVRDALAAGHLTLAETLLGRPYSISGRVLHGHRLGRELGWPTANIQLRFRRIPLQGIYVVSVMHQGHLLPGVASIGYRPSVNTDGHAHLEVHLLDFQGDLYGQRLEVRFHHKLRDEAHFDGLEALCAAIAQDVRDAREFWAAHANLLMSPYLP